MFKYFFAKRKLPKEQAVFHSLNCERHLGFDCCNVRRERSRFEVFQEKTKDKLNIFWKNFKYTIRVFFGRGY